MVCPVCQSESEEIHRDVALLTKTNLDDLFRGQNINYSTYTLAICKNCGTLRSH